MSFIVQVLVSLIPLAIALVLLKIFKLKIPNMIDFFLIGFIVCSLVSIIQKPIDLVFGDMKFWVNAGGLLRFLNLLITAGITEEVCKFIGLKLSKPKTKSQTMVNAILVGCMFTIIENYLYFGFDLSIRAIIFRTIIEMHMLFQIIMAFFLIKAKDKGKGKILFYTLALLVPIILHTIYDCYVADGISNNLFVYIILSGVNYLAIIYAIKYAGKLQKEESQIQDNQTQPMQQVNQVVKEEKKKDKFLIPKIIALVIIAAFYLFSGNVSNTRKKLNEICKYDVLDISVISSQRVTIDSLGKQQDLIKVFVKIKNNGTTPYDIPIFGGFSITSIYNTEYVPSEYIILESDALGDQAGPGEEITGAVYFDVEGEPSKYKIKYSEPSNYINKDEKPKDCIFSITN